MNNFLTDLRHAFRQLFKNPAFTAVAVLALGIGVGANSAIYSVADALLFRPLMIPEVDRVIAFGGLSAGDPELDELSPADYLDLREWARTMDHMSGWHHNRFNATGGGAEPEALEGARVSPAFFDAFAVKPLLGRTFAADEEEPGRDRVVILSRNLWERRFAADPDILQRTIELNGEAHQIVGVMPEEMRFPPQAELWAPFSLTAERQTARGSFFVLGVARLKPGAALGQARAELATLAKRFAQEHPQTHAKRSASAELVRTMVSGYYTAQYIVMLLGAVGFLLLLACTNVANLHYARISARARDLAIRSALGAGRLRIVRQLLTESGALGLLGALSGIVLAAWGIDVIRRGMPAEVEVFLPGWKRIAVDGRIVAYTAAIAVLSGVAAGLISAFAGSRVSIQEILKDAGRGTTSGARRHRVRSVLVVTQMVLANVLLTGAGLMVRGFQAIATPAPNLDAASVYTMRVLLTESRYAERAQLTSFAERLLSRLETLPGVESAALSSTLPYSSTRSSSSLTIDGHPEPPPGELYYVQMESVTPGYLKAMRISLRRGRFIEPRDGADAPLVGVVNEALVRRKFPNEDPIGKRVKVSRDAKAPWITIVGVAADIRHNNTDRTIRPLLYRPLPQAPPRTFYAALRTHGDAGALGVPARAAVYAVDPQQPVYRAQSYQKLIEQHMTGLGYVASTMAVSGVLALLLSVIGIYSVMAYSVTERTHEIGVRMALGAAQRDVQWQVVRGGLSLTAIGLVIGLALAFGMAQLLSGLIFGVSSGDFASFGGVTLLLVASATLACWLPARRASRVDPMIALRNE